MSVPLLDLIGLDAAIEQFPILVSVDVGIVRIGQVAQRESAHLLGRVPCDPAHRVIHAQQPAAMSTSAMPIGACVNAFSKALRMGHDSQGRIAPQTDLF